LIDLFPMGSPLPYRIDLFDNQIESIRTFDVDSQRTVYPVPRVRLLPAREFPQDESGRTRFRGRFREVFEGDPSKSPLYKDVSNGIMPAGIEYYLPLFFDTTATLAEYLPPETLVCLHGDVTSAIRRFWEDTDARYRLLRGDRARPLLAPHELFVPEDEFHRVLKPFSRIELVADASAAPDVAETDATAPVAEQITARAKGSRKTPATQPLPTVQVDRRADDPLRALKRHVTATRERVLIAAESLGRRETMQQYFAEYGFKPAVVADWAEFIAGDASPALVASPLHAGFVWPEANVALITEAELYAGVVRRPGKRDAAMSTRCCAIYPKCGSATPSCTSSTASAATSA
jgi:transcription-repair coupling factor (superfamily II helicase)